MKKYARGGAIIKHLANIVTVLRMAFSLALLFTAAFSPAFWAFYAAAGVSDMLDGPLARRLNQESEAGARLDSIADAVFALALALVLLTNCIIPAWLIISASAVALIKLACYTIGFLKYRAFSALHTYANKLTGALIFLSPVLILIVGVTATGIILCAVALAAAVEETVITIKSKTLERECRGLLWRACKRP